MCICLKKGNRQFYRYIQYFFDICDDLSPEEYQQNSIYYIQNRVKSQEGRFKSNRNMSQSPNQVPPSVINVSGSDHKKPSEPQTVSTAAGE